MTREITFVPFTPDHLSRIQLRPEQAEYYQRLVRPGYAESLATGPAWAAIDGDRVIGCAGLYPQWEGRAIAWAMFGDIPAEWGEPIMDRLRMLLADQPGRIEFTVPSNHGAACAVATELGFEVEALMKLYGPDGSDHFMFVRVSSGPHVPNVVL